MPRSTATLILISSYTLYSRGVPDDLVQVKSRPEENLRLQHAGQRKENSRQVQHRQQKDIDDAGMVDAANKLHKAIVAATAYDPDSNQASPLTGDSSTTRLAVRALERVH